MTNDFRALLLELADALDHNRQCLMDDRSLTHPLAARARAALAEGEKGPSDEELLELVSWSGHAFASDLVGFARAVLARYGSAPRPIPAHALPIPENADD